jgi:GNAT superfamily N-acetyltransferase
MQNPPAFARIGRIRTPEGETVNPIEIVKVQTRRDLGNFIRFPWKIYAGNPCWVPPLILDMKDRLNRRKHPFFEHAEADCFLARRGGETVGRVAAILDRNHNTHHKDKTAFFGLYESVNEPDVARSLIETAASWAAERGLEALRGPMNLSMNDECAFLLEGFDAPPVVMMPYNPPYYIELMEKCGMAKAKDLFAFQMHRSHPTSDKVRAIVDRLRNSGHFKFRKVTRASIRDDALKIAAIYNSGWQNNWGFVPWTEKEMEHMAQNLAWFADLDIVLFAEHEGRPVGFAFGFPNLNEVLIRMNGRLFPFGLVRYLAGRRRIKSCRALVFGVVPEFMHTGLAYLLYDEFETAIISRGYEWCELSWQLEDNEPINHFAASIGAALYKKYRIFEKRITPGGA